MVVSTCLKSRVQGSVVRNQARGPSGSCSESKQGDLQGLTVHWEQRGFEGAQSTGSRGPSKAYSPQEARGPSMACSLQKSRGLQGPAVHRKQGEIQGPAIHRKQRGLQGPAVHWKQGGFQGLTVYRKQRGLQGPAVHLKQGGFQGPAQLYTLKLPDYSCCIQDT